MKKVIVSVMLGMILLNATAYGASSCEYNTIVQGWIAERDRDALRLTRAWLSGEHKETLAPLVGLVLEAEIKVSSICRNEVDFLERNRLLYGKLTYPLTVDTVPPHVFQRIIGDDMLSPERQYREEKKEVRRGKNR